jgi:CHASE2 domain-containing sensor protein
MGMNKISVSIVSAFLFLGTMVSCEQQEDVDVVIVDVAGFGRYEIARQVENLQVLRPRVIGMGILFLDQKEHESDSLLQASLNKCYSLVMPSFIMDELIETEKEYDSLIRSDSAFAADANTGFMNLLTEDNQFEPVERFSMWEKAAGKKEYNFAVQVAMKYDSTKTSRFLRENSRVVEIDYRGNSDKFKIISARDAYEGKIHKADIEDKIVLIGAFDIRDEDARCYAPIGNTPRGFRNMYEIVYEANVVAQILE